MSLFLRPSGMPLAFACPGSVRAPMLRIREKPGEAADTGTATHEALRPVVETGQVPWDALPAIASRYACDEEELRALVAMGAKLWKQIDASFPDATTERRMSMAIGDETLEGTTDIASGRILTEDFRVGVRLADWKSGRKDTDYSQQMRAYAALALASDLDLKVATATIIWIRDGEIENLTMSRNDAAAWVHTVQAQIINWDGTYHPGGHCAWCPRGHECEARSALVRRSIAEVLNTTDPQAALALMQPDQILELHAKVKLIETVSGKVLSALREHVAQHGEVAANGQRLTMATEERRRLDPVAAWSVLEESGFNDNSFAECMTLSLSKAEKVAASMAGKGKGAKAVRELDDKLAKAGAIKTYEIKKLVTRRG